LFRCAEIIKNDWNYYFDWNLINLVQLCLN
jgi:hypothetical protein